MPLFNDKGEEIEGAMTPDEVEAKIEEATTKIRDEAIQDLEEFSNEKEEEMKSILEEKEGLEEKLKILETKDTKGFQNLRQKKDEQIEALTEQIKGLATKLEGFEETTKQKVKNEVDDIINKLAKGDEELVGKIKDEFGQFADPVDVTDRNKKITKAYKLATGQSDADDVLSGDIVASGGLTPTTPKAGAGGKLQDEASKDVAKNLGITDQEMSKHGLT